ncbi:MAG: TolC family protein [Saprospiraceae bacterium]
MRSAILYIFLGMCFGTSIFGQERTTLTLDDAIAIGIKNNFNILIAVNDIAIANANNTMGNAGMLPEVALNVGQSFNVNDSKLEFSDGSLRTGSSVNSNATTANISAAWTLYNGKQMFVTKDKLETLAQIANTSLKFQTELLIYQIKTQYLRVLQQKDAISITEKNLALTNERRKLLQLKQSVGTGSGLAVLQAESDYNQDSLSLVNQTQSLEQLKIELNNLLSRNPITDFDVENIKINDDLATYEFLKSKMDAYNTSLSIYDLAKQIAELDITFAKGSALPTVNLNTGYNFARSQTELGVLKYSQNSGVNLGITGRWVIYDGNNIKRNTQIAKLNAQNTALEYQRQKQDLDNQLYAAYTSYTQATALEKITASNVAIAEETLKTSREMMRLGSITNIDLRQSELNLADANYRKLNAKYQKLFALLHIEFLTGDYVK